MSKKTLEVWAPLDGLVIPLVQVPDPVFAGQMVGLGVGIEPTSSVLRAPCAGEVVQLHRAKHAISLATAEGFQILMHIGIDSVKLNGAGFRPLVKLGDKVSRGQALIEFDADIVAAGAKSLITLVLATDVVDGQVKLMQLSKPVTAGKESLFTVQDLTSASLSSQKAKASAQTQTPATNPAANSQNTVDSPLFSVRLPAGLHARPAALLAGMAKSYRSEIQVIKGERSANARSLVGVLGLEITKADQIRIRAQGLDAQMAALEIAEFLQDLEENEDAHVVTTRKAQAQPSKRERNANTLWGVGVSSGVAIGRIYRVQSETFAIVRAASQPPNEERAQLTDAIETALTQLQNLARDVQAKNDAAIFAAHQELLEDPDILTQALAEIERGSSAAYAWEQSISSHADRLSNLSNELMANRANDLRDVGRRVLRLLVKSSAPETHAIPPGSILIAENLTPSETVQLDRTKVLGFCTTSGGATSHVAILARSLGLPAIAGIEKRALELANGVEVILDGESGELCLNPSADAKAKAEGEQRQAQVKRESAMKVAHQVALTKEGRKIEVAANIGSLADARQAVEMGADGVGLLRSEFLFLERENAPSEDEQHMVYQEIANVLGARPLVIRTLDVGGDKPLKYLPLETEENPFLGVRGIRISFLHPEVFREQLRAIVRVKAQSPIHVMFPMIASIEEFRKAKAMLMEERERLKITHEIKVGIMVEVPSAALSAEALAREADFFSIGTNDLTQYTLAMDRGHKGLAQQVDALHPSVLRLIEMSVKAAHAHGKWVGVCGGLASDLKAVPILIGLGVDELSVSIPSIPLVKAEVRETVDKDAKGLAARALSVSTGAEVRNIKVTASGKATDLFA
jgi:phosphoenolpyruvate-protein phosphotransferase